jgi:hypothetical protein
MVSTTLSSTSMPVPTRAQGIWLATVQVVGVLATAAALYVAPRPERPVQLLLALLCAAAVVITAVPAWRQSAAAAVLGGLALAVAVWLGATARLWEYTFESGDLWEVPYAAFALVGLAFLLALWGVPVMRKAPPPPSRFGAGAMVGALYLSALAVLLFVGLNFLPVLAALYKDAVSLTQLLGLVTPVLTYALALWLGGAGVRPGARLALQPPLLAVLLAAMLIFWQMKR